MAAKFAVASAPASTRAVIGNATLQTEDIGAIAILTIWMEKMKGFFLLVFSFYLHVFDVKFNIENSELKQIFT